MKDDEKKYLNEKEAAKIYGYSIFWFRRKRWSGDGPPFIKMGHRVAYRPDDLANYFDKFKPCNSTAEYHTRRGGNKDEV